MFAWIEDRNGHGKLPPGVVVTPDAEVEAADELVVVAVTPTFTDPPPHFCVTLPWHPRGHPVTHLNRRSAAVVNWLAAISREDVVGFGGDVPAKTMRLIQRKLDELA